jgi:ADP-ribose pyrophosphatase YjhB (NUDIX family)
MAITCYRKCQCQLVVTPKPTANFYDDDDLPKCCAGVCVISRRGILVSQSYNLYWGIPKGIVNPQESLRHCALRELYEETNLKLEPQQLSRVVFNFRYKNIHRRVCVFFAFVDDTEALKASVGDEESTGYGFIHPTCLLELFYSGKIKINYFTRVLINKIFL